MRNTFIFLYEDIKFDVLKYKIVMSDGTSKYWLRFRLFLWRRQIIFGYNFVAPLKLKI